ncbi:MAG: T9SS type A sorting domain-containing protein [Chitinophagales bacterium]|nr:T9SS type A sorting domain-containing protein [Chitinophagales bacterium]
MYKHTLLLILLFAGFHCYGQTGDITASNGPGYFIEGVTNQENIITITNEPSNTDQVSFFLYDANDVPIDNFVDNDGSDGWEWTLEMGDVEPDAYIQATYIDANGFVTDFSPTLYLNIIPVPDWLSDGEAEAIGISGNIMTLKCTIPISDISTTIPTDIKAIGGKDVGLVDCSVIIEVDFDMDDASSSIQSTPELSYTLDILDLSNDGIEELTGVGISFDQDFNIEAFSYSDSLDLVAVNKDFAGLSFPLAGPMTLRIAGGMGFEGKLYGKLVYGTDGNDWGFIEDGNDTTRLYARALGYGNISAGLEVLGGVASATGTITVTGGIGAGFNYFNVPAEELDTIFGGYLKAEGSVKLKALSNRWVKKFTGFGGIELGEWNKCFYGCDGSTGTFGYLPSNKTINSLSYPLFDGQSVTYKVDATSTLPEYLPQPSFGTRGNDLAAVWFEYDEDNDYLLLSKLNEDGTAFSEPVTVAMNDNAMSNPKVALLPSGSAIVTWTQNRFNSDDLTSTTQIEDIIDAQDIWAGIYDEATGTMAEVIRLSDDTSTMQSGRAEGQARIAMGTGENGIITWVSQEPASLLSDVWFSTVSETASDWTLSEGDKLAELPGANYDVHVAFTDSVNAIAVWINDPDANDSTLDNTIMYAEWDGNTWSAPEELTQNNGDESFDAISLAHNDGYTAVAWTGTTYDSDDDLTKTMDVQVWDNLVGEWSTQNDFHDEDTAYYFNYPRISISDQGILSVVYQVFEKHQDADNPDEGNLYMYLKDLNSSDTTYEDITGSPYLSDPTTKIIDVDAGFGDDNVLYILTQETDPDNGTVTNPPYGVMFGEADLSMVLRGLQVNNDLSVSDYNEPDVVPDGIEGYSKTDNGRLFQNFPNPFRGTTTLQFNLNSTGTVSLEVIDLTGRNVATLINGQQLQPGLYNTLFNSGNLNEGVYFYRLTLNGRCTTKKMVISR